MGTFGNAILGLAFLFLAVFNTFFMFKLWGYPFDHEKLKSSAPPRLMLLHRLVGYVFLAIYVYMMSQMLPRLWTYQVELPARTVAHLVLGMTIGILLLVKIVIVRFFKHLESAMVPFLATAVLICTTLLIGLSVPIAFKEVLWSRSAVGGTAYSTENLERVKTLLAHSQLPPSASLERIASRFGLEQGRGVLMNKCVQCHDLRTVLIKPRTPDTWIQTVERMAERSLFDPISEEEQWYVTAYLVAISPDLHNSLRQKREQESMVVQAKMTAEMIANPLTLKSTSAAPPGFNLNEAKEIFETTCTGCHSLKNVERRPPKSESDARNLVAKMINEGLDASPGELENIIFYLTKTYTK